MPYSSASSVSRVVGRVFSPYRAWYKNVGRWLTTPPTPTTAMTTAADTAARQVPTAAHP